MTDTHNTWRGGEARDRRRSHSGDCGHGERGGEVGEGWCSLGKESVAVQQVEGGVFD